jgi:hypothetical protein
MNQAEVLAVMNDPVAQRLIAAPIHARLAYTVSNGDPRVVPVGYLWNGAEIVTCSPANAAKVTSLQRHPRVALTIDSSSFPPNILLVRGNASVEIVDGVPDDFVKGSRRFIPDEGWEDWQAGVDAMYKQMARIAIAPDWAKVIDFETRLPSAIAELLPQ